MVFERTTAMLTIFIASPSPSPSPVVGDTPFYDSAGAKIVGLVVLVAGFIWAIVFGGRGIGQLVSDWRTRRTQKLMDKVTSNPFSVAPVAHDNLPPHGVLYGRLSASSASVEKLLAHETLHIKGPAGIGKSSFALQVAQEFLARRPEYRAFHTSAKTKSITSDSLADSIGRFFGVPAIESSPDLEAKSVILHRILYDEKLLLILDNVETVAPEVLAFADTLPSNVTTIRTSRTAPPAHDGSSVEELRPLGAEAQRELMSAELKRLNLGTLDNYPPTQVNDLLELTGGNPLAIKWATGRLSSGISIHSVVERLRRGDADLFENLFADNWTEMSTAGKRALMCVSVQGFTVGEDILFPQVSNNNVETERAVSQLVNLGLLEPSPDVAAAGRMRYGLHPLARLFAQKKLNEEVSRRNEVFISVLTSIADFFEARRLGQQGQEQYERLEGELDGAETALSWLNDGMDPGELPVALLQAAQSVINACSVLLWSRGDWERRATQAQLSVRLAQQTADSFQESRSAATAGIVRFWQGRLDEAEDWSVKSGRALPNGSSLEKGLSRRLKALVMHRRGDTGAAVAEMLTVLDAVREINTRSEKAREVARLYADWVCTGAAGHRTGEVALTQEIGIMYTDRAQVAEAIYWLDKSRAIADQIGDPEGASVALSHKGRAQMQDWPEEARLDFEEGLRLSRQVGRMSTEGRCLLGLATLGEGEDALTCLESARSIFTRLGMATELNACSEVEARLRAGDGRRWRMSRVRAKAISNIPSKRS